MLLLLHNAAISYTVFTRASLHQSMTLYENTQNHQHTYLVAILKEIWVRSLKWTAKSLGPSKDP